MNSLEDYLKQRYTFSTVNTYMRIIARYLNDYPNAFTANYHDIIHYMHNVRLRYNNTHTVQIILTGIKVYYNYLLHTQQRIDNPCKALLLKHNKTIVPTTAPLSKEELIEIVNYKSKHSTNHLRNSVLLQLIVHQGLTRTELGQLKTEHVNLEKGTVTVLATNINNARTLSLQATQILLLQQYMQCNTTDYILGTQAQIVVMVNWLLKKVSAQLGKRVTITTLRQSIIIHQLESNVDVRYVQVFIGHKQVMSTQRYKTADITLLSNAVQAFHPMQ